LYLSKFDFTSKYIPETKIRKTNRLSRRLDWKIGVENDNKNKKLIKKKCIQRLVKVVVKESEVNIIEKIKRIKNSR